MLEPYSLAVAFIPIFKTGKLRSEGRAQMALGFRSGGRFSLCWFPKQGCPTASSVLSVWPAHGLLHMRRSAVLADPVPVLVMWGSSAAHMLFPVIKILLQLVLVLTLIKICTAYKIGNRIP